METPSPLGTHEPWIVTRATTARRAMVIDVEADSPEDARTIAAEIVGPFRAKYEEVLIYIRPIGSPLNAVTRRVEWTPRGGFVETMY
jgi:hypothetical protein